ncbi:MAG: hypothetical protein ACRDSS_00425 [Actinocrinis sp.]
MHLAHRGAARFGDPQHYSRGLPAGDRQSPIPGERIRDLVQNPIELIHQNVGCVIGPTA